MSREIKNRTNQKPSHYPEALARARCWPLFLAALFLASSAACGAKTVESRWLDRTITVDGDDADWRGAMDYYEFEQADLAAGVRNDGEFLYACVVTTSREVRARLMGQGLIIWFDPAGGKEKDIGLKYPIRRARDAGLAAFGGRAAQEERGDRSAEERRIRREALRESLEEFEILDAYMRKGDTYRLGAVDGLEIRLRTTPDELVYELKVPLAAASGSPFRIGARPGRPLGIGVEFPRPDVDELRRAAGGRGRIPVGVGGMGGRRPPLGGYGTRRPGMGGGQEIWFRVNLAGGENPPGRP